MRTTVTLDTDVEQLIRRAMEQRRSSFKQVLNESLRRALKEGGGEQEPPFVVTARPMGLRSGIDPAALHDLDGELEAQELIRKTRALEAVEP
jgi:hypothetical protein